MDKMLSRVLTQRTKLRLLSPGRYFYNWRTTWERPRRKFSFNEKEIQTQALKRFEGKSVLITGGAGDLGSTTARLFSEQGARIVLCDLASTEAKLKQLTTELLSLGSPSVIYASVDVANIEDVKKCVQLAVEEFGGIDILFNTHAFLGTINPVHETDELIFKKVQDTNVYGTFLMMKYVSNKMIESGRGGVICNTSSFTGVMANPFAFPYITSKFAINGMSRAAARSLAKYNIRVNSLAPGVLEGGLADHGHEAIALKG